MNRLPKTKRCRMVQRKLHVEVTKKSIIMNTKTFGPACLRKIAQSCVVTLCSALLTPGVAVWASQMQEKPNSPVPKEATVNTSPEQQEAAELPPEQLNALVGPIALYPDPMLAHILAASTDPL
jgi:hypothetical protein